MCALLLGQSGFKLDIFHLTSWPHNKADKDFNYLWISTSISRKDTTRSSTSDSGVSGGGGTLTEGAKAPATDRAPQLRPASGCTTGSIATGQYTENHLHQCLLELNLDTDCTAVSQTHTALRHDFRDDNVLTLFRVIHRYAQNSPNYSLENIIVELIKNKRRVYYYVLTLRISSILYPYVRNVRHKTTMKVN